MQIRAVQPLFGREVFVMKFTAKRLLAAGAIGVSAIVTPIAVTVALPGVGGLTTVAEAQGSGPDTITFNQPAGTPDTYVFTSPTNGTQTTQQVTPSGKCGTPSVSGGSPILSLTGKQYNPTSNSNYYLNSSSSDPASLTAGAVGACNISPPQSLENKSGKGAEALDFSVLGANTSIIGSGRLFTGAQLWIQRKDSGVAQNPSVNVVLVEFDAVGNQVGSQSCLINGGQGTNVLADTATSAGDAQSDCTGTPAPQSGFATVEVQDWTTSTSISVVTPPPAVGGPSATFTLANTVCGGQTVNANATQGSAAVSLTLNEASSVCKSFTAFTSNESQGADNVEFDASGFSDLHFGAGFVWPAQAYCTPDGSNSTPICAPDTVSYSDPVTGLSVVSQDQMYCAAATPADQLCTTNKAFNYLEPQTTVAAGSSGQAIGSLTSGQLSVVSTSGLLASGQVTVVTSGGLAALKYTGTSGGNTLTGVTVASGSNTWVVSTGDAVAQAGRPATTVAAGSNGQAVGSLASLSVVDSSGLLASGQVSVATSTGSAVLNYTGITNNTLNGVTLASGSGTVSTGGAVDQTQTVIVEIWSGLLDFLVKH
jgi:hypothetical protein